MYVSFVYKCKQKLNFDIIHSSLVKKFGSKPCTVSFTVWTVDLSDYVKAFDCMQSEIQQVEHWCVLLPELQTQVVASEHRSVPLGYDVEIVSVKHLMVDLSKPIGYSIS